MIEYLSEFYKRVERLELAESPMVDSPKERIYLLDHNAMETIMQLFIKMQQESETDYSQRGDMMRCYLHLIVHEAMKMQHLNQYAAKKNASQRIAELFLALLERQFPICIPEKMLTLKSATDYAECLSVHVNHLNRVVKATTGRTTSAIITGRIIQEALQLLQQTNHPVAEIAFALGFEEPASFSNFLKKHTNMSPTEQRGVVVS